LHYFFDDRDLDRATGIYGDRGYRYVNFEAGAIGHRLFSPLRALGLGATGIGAFYDDEVHRPSQLDAETRTGIYHLRLAIRSPIRALQHPMRTGNYMVEGRPILVSKDQGQAQSSQPFRPRSASSATQPQVFM